MIDISKGRYWDDGIKLVSRCTPCSPGCDNCWALAMEKRFEAQHDIARMKFIGVHPERLKRFNTRKPKVCAIWNDLFHEDVPDDFQNEVYKAMILNKQNIYLILTKRPQIMARFLSPESCFSSPIHPPIWHGLTVCNQQEADEKIPIFLQVPGKKFLSIEPMLGPIILDCVDYPNGWRPKHQDSCGIDPLRYERSHIDAVILGGETGAGARPLHPDWVRSVRDQCQSAGVPFFFKQWGEWAPATVYKSFEYIQKHRNRFEVTQGDKNDRSVKSLLMMEKVGRKKAGRILDGRTHDELPWAKVKI